MTDTSAYINTYLENTMGMIHENISTILQLKTQAKLSSDLIKARGEEVTKLQEEIEKLKTELESSKSDIQGKMNTTVSELQGKLDSTRSELENIKTVNNEQINQARADARKWEDECNVLKNKVSVVDTLTNQFNDIKQQHKKTLEELNSVKKENSKLQNTVIELEEIKKLLAEKDQQLEEYEKQNVKRSSQLSPKKSINTKNIVPPPVEPEEKADDF
jgi:chromosome segregation ATPase